MNRSRSLSLTTHRGTPSFELEITVYLWDSKIRNIIILFSLEYLQTDSQSYMEVYVSSITNILYILQLYARDSRE